MNMKRKPCIIDEMLDKLDTKVKLNGIFEEADYPKTLSKTRFINITEKYIKGGIENYKHTANVIFNNKKNREFFYREIKNKNYNFGYLLKDTSKDIIRERLKELNLHNEYDSFVSRNYITVVIDKMECERTTDNFEKNKKLHKAENGHYLINLCFVIGDDKEIYPFNSVLYDPDCGKTSIDIAREMVLELLDLIKESGIELNRVRFSADREFLNEKILSLFYNKDFEVIKCVIPAKKNTVYYNKNGIKSNMEELKEKLFYERLDDFKYSTQLDTWASNHDRPRYKYYTLIRFTNFGKVRIVAFFDSSKRLTEDNFHKHIIILINPNANMTAIQMIKTLRGHRWHIEVFHKDLKQNLEIVKSYRGLDFIGLRNHYILRVYSYLVLSYYIHLKSSWKKTIGILKRYIAMQM